MSFGPTAQTRQAFSTLGSNAGAAGGAAVPQITAGGSNLAAGANLFRTLLGGNAQNTAELLQPDIDRIRNANQQTLQAVSTLTPRGGGRSSTLFQLPFQSTQQIQNLFNSMRGTAAQALPGIGAQQGSLGTNLFNISNSAGRDLGQLGLSQQELSNKLMSSLGQGLFNIATLPLSGLSGTLLGKAIPGIGG